MNQKRAKGFRRMAEQMTIGKPKHITRQKYKRLKKVYKLEKGEL